jgi:hypothetical protein
MSTIAIMTPSEPWWRQTVGAHGQAGRIDIYHGFPYDNYDGGQNCAKMTVQSSNRIKVELDLSTFQSFTGTFWIKIGGGNWYVSTTTPSESWNLSPGTYDVSFDCTIVAKSGTSGSGIIKVYVKDSTGLLIGTFLLFYTIPPSSGSIVTIYSAKDANLRQSQPDINFGSTTAMYVNSGPGINSRALIEFPLNQIPAGKMITSARVYFMLGDTIKYPKWHIYSRIIEPWNELAVTWNTQPNVTTENATRLLIPNVDGGGHVDFDITALVKDAYNLGQSSLGLRIQCEIEDDPDMPTMFYVPREGEPQWQPYLVIQYSEPTQGILELHAKFG